jgi:polyisoprenoid-binding protein YceI
MHSVARLCLAGFGLLLAAAAARAQTAPEVGRYALDAAKSSIVFSIGHFYVSSTEGRFTSFDGRLVFARETPERGNVTIHVSPGSIDTGIAARDDHLRSADFFDVAKYPLVRFESTGLVRTGNTGTLTGMLTLHGVTRPVTFAATLQTPDLNGNRLAFSATGTLKRSDFGMTDYMGVIGDEVTLKIEAEFDRER